MRIVSGLECQVVGRLSQVSAQRHIENRFLQRELTDLVNIIVESLQSGQALTS